MNTLLLKYLIIFWNILLLLALEFEDDDSHWKMFNKKDEKNINSSILITKLLVSNNNGKSTIFTTKSPQAFKINQSLDIKNLKNQNQTHNFDIDQSMSFKTLPKAKYVNKSSADNKMIRQNLNLSQSKVTDNQSWKCPNITDYRSLECGCDVPLTLRCSGDVHGLSLIADGLRKSKFLVSILDCTLRNVTVINEARIFENISLTGLFISSGEIKRFHRLTFSGLKIPLRILGLSNNALTYVPSKSLEQLTLLDRLDLSNNDIKILSPTDFIALKNLNYLELSENHISSISPKTFVSLKNLVTLKLNGNKLGNSPESLQAIAECVNLRELDLKSNLIKGSLNSDILPILRDLESLNLERNSFSSVERETFKNFHKLICLSLNHNQIDVISDDAFYGLNVLEKLDLSYNGIVAVSEGSLKHMNRLVLLDFTHNFLRAITADIISPLPQLKELKLDGNDIAFIEKNALTSAKKLKVLSLRDNPLACDCKLQYFAEWLSNTTQISSNDLMAFCKTPPFLEGAQLSQLKIEKLTCTEVNNLESDADKIMLQINSIYSNFLDNFTLVNSSDSIKFVNYNFTNPSILNLMWSIHLKKNIDFHSIIIFEESNIRIRLDRTMVNISISYEELFYISIPWQVSIISGNVYEFCLIFLENDYQLFIGCSNRFSLNSRSKILQSLNHDSDIANLDIIANKKDDQIYTKDDMITPLFSTKINGYKNNIKKIDLINEHDDTINVYPSEGYYNTLWPNLSLSFLIMCMSISIIYILYSKYCYYYKHPNRADNSISPSYSDDSINTQVDDENSTNKYVKLQATTAL